MSDDGSDVLDADAGAWVRSNAPAPIAGTEVLRRTARSTVARVVTANGAFYFKHDRILPPPECAVIARLARRWPARVPSLVAADEQRGWSLTRDAGPPGLDGAPTATWCRVTRSFGELQRDTGTDVDDWLALGCRDLRGDRLRVVIDEMLETARGHLDSEVAQRVDALRPKFAEACADLAGDGIPPSLVHQDLVDENVVVQDDGIVVLDWSDTVVGHPFFGCDRFLDACWRDAERKAAVIDAYLGAFEGLASPERLRASFRRVLRLRVLYEDLRWHHEIAAAGPDTEHSARLRRDLVAGLTMVANACR